MTIRQALQDATRALQPDLTEARFEARLLLEHSLQKPHSWLISHDDERLSDQAYREFTALLTRRKSGEPLAYITGEKEFWSLGFKVTADVLIPRPDTELLVETALEKLCCGAGAKVIDLGTGSGAIAVALAHECPDIEITATDASDKALDIARINADTHCSNRIRFQRSDWFDALADQHFDLILSNPPYIEADDVHLSALRYEPMTALVAGKDGLDDLRIIISQAPAHLKDSGWLILEHGAGQGEDVRSLLTDAGFTGIATRHDLAGLERVTLGQIHA